MQILATNVSNNLDTDTYHYKAFGTWLTGVVQLPWLFFVPPPVAVNTPLFGPRQINIGFLSHKLQQQVVSPHPEVHCRGETLTMSFSQGFGFVVSAEQIQVSVIADKLTSLMQQRLITAGIAGIFCFHHYLQLHGSVVDFNGRRIIVIGQRGAGKTSFISDALAHGAQLVADDITLIRPDFAVVPAFPSIRIQKQLPVPPGFKDFGDVPGAPKKKYCRTDRFAPDDIKPADLILHLRTSAITNEWQVVAPNNIERLQALHNNLYRPRIQMAHPVYSSMLKHLLNYAAETPMIQITRPAAAGTPYRSLLSVIPERLL